ncbi:hypothetical protein DRH13_00135 [Candidatus Woesebacteria bacterium]|nr:MAG: hypothetical protein DRH13_00135 [Candidatus Woesebacteria bacterium]
MSALGKGTTLLGGNNGSTLLPITIPSGGFAGFNHGLGSKSGFGGRAPVVNVFLHGGLPGNGEGWGVNVGAGSGVSQVVFIIQPETSPGSGIYDEIIFFNALPGPPFLTEFIVEIIWEFPSAELDLVLGNLNAPNVVTDLPYVSSTNPTGRFTFIGP